MSNDPQYDAEQAMMHARYHKLLAQYTEKPFATRHTDKDVEASLTLVEEAMLAHPPLCECETEDGRKVWLPRKPGILEESPLPAGTLPQPTMLDFKTESGLVVIPESQWPDLINDQNRTPPSHYCPFTLDQQSVGSCGAEGSVSGLMGRRAADGQKHVLLNPWAVYHTTSGGRDGGSNPADNLAFLQKYGCPSQAVWPRSKGWRTAPSDEAMKDALQYRIAQDGLVRLSNWNELATCLLLGFICPLGYSGHWICGTDLVSSTRVQYKNSWGSDWGDDGFGTLSKSSIMWSYGVWAVTATVDMSGP